MAVPLGARAAPAADPAPAPAADPAPTPRGAIRRPRARAGARARAAAQRRCASRTGDRRHSSVLQVLARGRRAAQGAIHSPMPRHGALSVLPGRSPAARDVARARDEANPSLVLWWNVNDEDRGRTGTARRCRDPDSDPGEIISEESAARPARTAARVRPGAGIARGAATPAVRWPLPPAAARRRGPQTAAADRRRQTAAVPRPYPRRPNAVTRSRRKLGVCPYIRTPAL